MKGRNLEDTLNVTGDKYHMSLLTDSDNLSLQDANSNVKGQMSNVQCQRSN